MLCMTNITRSLLLKPDDGCPYRIERHAKKFTIDTLPGVQLSVVMHMVLTAEKQIGNACPRKRPMITGIRPVVTAMLAR